MPAEGEDIGAVGPNRDSHLVLCGKRSVGGDVAPSIVKLKYTTVSERKHRLDVENHARHDRLTLPFLRNVRHDGRLMQFCSNTVTGELSHDRTPCPCRLALHCGSNVAKTTSCLCRSRAGERCTPCCPDQSPLFVPEPAYAVRPGGVGHPAGSFGADVYRNEITGSELVVPGEPMSCHVVDGCADQARESLVPNQDALQTVSCQCETRDLLEVVGTHTGLDDEGKVAEYQLDRLGGESKALYLETGLQRHVRIHVGLTNASRAPPATAAAAPITTATTP